MKVQVMVGTDTSIESDAAGILRERDVCVLPEFKAPQPRNTNDGCGVEWVWGQGRGDTMTPFWAVRRMTK